MLRRFFVFSAVCSAVFCLGASRALAAEIPPGVFQMANGSYYHPASGFTSTDLEGMLAHLNPEDATPTATSSSDLIGDTSASSTATSTVPELFPLKKAIVRAREILQTQIDAAVASSTSPTVVPEEPEWRDVTLALWNPQTDIVRFVDAKKRGTDLKVLDNDPSKISVVTSNGVNSTFVVKGETEELVVAVRYPLYKEQGTAKKRTYLKEEVVYTPYSAALHTPEMIAYGQTWLDEMIAAVYAKLRDEQIGSRAFSGKLLADVIDPRFAKSILFIEHVDDRADVRAARIQWENFATILAGNEGRSYAYARSGPGALGIAQFMPSTYAALVRRADLHLIPSFEEGMRDPENVIRAEVAYLDELMAYLPNDVVDKEFVDHPERLQEYIAAAYNGGPAIVKKALVVWEENLDPAERLHVRKRSRLKPETMQYVLKLRRVRSIVP